MRDCLERVWPAAAGSQRDGVLGLGVTAVSTNVLNGIARIGWARQTKGYVE
jgi:hypothetical protein